MNAQQYSVTDLGAVGTRAQGINEFGQVVVVNQGTAFLWENGAVTNLNATGGNLLPFAGANAINDSGLIGGFVRTSSNALTQPVLWDGDNIVFLSTLPGLTGGTVEDMNNSGQWVGTLRETDPSSMRAVLWQNGTPTNLGVLPGDHSSEARAINDLGQIVGVSVKSNSTDIYSYIWSNGVMTNLGALDGAKTQAWDINNLGQVVGQSGNYTFIWQNGAMTALPNLDGFITSAGLAINNQGDAVGYIYSTSTFQNASLWKDGAVYNLNNLIPADSGWFLQMAMDINEQGQIVGSGWRQGVGSSAFLLTPIPEPSTTALLLTALASALFAVRKRRNC